MCRTALQRITGPRTDPTELGILQDNTLPHLMGPNHWPATLRDPRSSLPLLQEARWSWSRSRDCHSADPASPHPPPPPGVPRDPGAGPQRGRGLAIAWPRPRAPAPPPRSGLPRDPRVAEPGDGRCWGPLALDPPGGKCWACPQEADMWRAHYFETSAKDVPGMAHAFWSATQATLRQVSTGTAEGG
ncbi:actin cytoskeleton-regulatory complex protein PAN1-like [Pteropus medius]|uniref:actin cytoskeleton-regulatory complex protein PAN1-like n=1 Tax=Pteropus vampyrus TaxID=132908 RepID=UPI00196AC30A|nr:actin cytoskeleton-regulatory complex protein PAN1-like [Pteropus giganteus]